MTDEQTTQTTRQRRRRRSRGEMMLEQIAALPFAELSTLLDRMRDEQPALAAFIRERLDRLRPGQSG